MSEAADAPLEGALTVDQAVGLLGHAPEPERKDETPSGDQPETTDDGAETPAVEEPAEEQEPATPEVQAPQYWSKEAKERFAELPPELQAVVMAEEKGRESASGKAKQEAAEARKAAEHQAGVLRAQAARLNELVPQLEATLTGKWDGATPEAWAGLARSDPDKYVTLKADFDADMAKLSAAREAKAQSDGEAQTSYLREQTERLQAMNPELAKAIYDPKAGGAQRERLASYLTTIKADPAEFNALTSSALGLTLVQKAMLYDQGKAKLAEPKPPAPPARTVRPSGAPAGTSQQRSTQTAANRFAQTKSIDAAVDLLLSRQGT